MTNVIPNLSDRFSGTTQVKPSSEQPSPHTGVRRASDVVEEAETVRHVPEVNPQDKAEIEDTVKKLNIAVEQLQKGLNFSIDEKSGGFVIRIVDQSTDETIRQIPSEDMLKIYQRMKEVNSLLFDDIKA